MRGLHGGHGAILRARDGDELFCAALLGVREVKVIADEQQECVVTRELRRARDRVRVAEGLRLFDEGEPRRVPSRRRAECRLVAGRNHDGDLLDARAEHFLDDDGERAFRDAITIHERLEGQAALAFACGGDDGFSDFHDGGNNVGSGAARSNSPRKKLRWLLLNRHLQKFNLPG